MSRIRLVYNWLGTSFISAIATIAVSAAVGCGGDDAGGGSATAGETTTTGEATTTTGDTLGTTTAATATTTAGGSASAGETTTTGQTTTEATTTEATTEATTTGQTTTGQTTETTTEDPSTTAAMPACGDGNLDPGEECDDGPANADDAACTSACTIATCGDGLVQAGVEECDDGVDNADSAACTSACILATCGDGLLHAGVEECDDGNLLSDDGCTAKCRIPPSCKEIHEDAPEEPDGIYIVVPEGEEPFEVWCDMSTDDGGWTLAYATREFRSKNEDPRVHIQDLANSSITSPDGAPMMFGHAVRGTAAEVMWRCSPDGVVDKWWVTSVPEYMLNQAHETPPEPITYERKSDNASKIPAFFIEGSNNFPQLGYFMINTTALSCTAANAVWGGYCFSYNCNGPGQSGQCIRSACDGVDVSNGGNPSRRFWLYYR